MNANISDVKSLLKDQYQQFIGKDLGVEREALSLVTQYQFNPQAVVISGLRRVGKSTLLAQIARKLYHDHCFFINFEDERLINFNFDQFDNLHQTLIELFDDQKVFLFDEVQNVVGWEHFVRRLIDSGYKCFITGSNASLLSQELGTKLTGRYLPIELYPFSFNEYLTFINYNLPIPDTLTTKESANINKVFSDYLIKGGIPDALKYPQADWHKTLYEDVIYRDIASRYQINEVKALKEMAFFLLGNTGAPISYNKLRQLLKLGSNNTITNYIDYLEKGWLFFPINRYSYSIKTQQIAPKKIYVIDNGFINKIAFSFSEQLGHLFENLVYLSIKKQAESVYYYKTKDDTEVDFYLPESKQLVQACYDISNPDVFRRETQALWDTMNELGIPVGNIVAINCREEIIKNKHLSINVIPAIKWFINK